MSWPRNPDQRSFKVIGTDTDRSATYNYRGLSRTVFEINGDFSRKSRNFATPVYFAPPAEEVPLELGTGAGGQITRMMGLYQAEEEVWRYLQPCGYNRPTWRTDTLIDTDRQQRPRLRLASCLNKVVHTIPIYPVANYQYVMSCHFAIVALRRLAVRMG